MRRGICRLVIDNCLRKGSLEQQHREPKAVRNVRVEINNKEQLPQGRSDNPQLGGPRHPPKGQHRPTCSAGD
jgi:hypothetical protein